MSKGSVCRFGEGRKILEGTEESFVVLFVIPLTSGLND